VKHILHLPIAVTLVDGGTRLLLLFSDRVNDLSPQSKVFLVVTAVVLSSAKWLEYFTLYIKYIYFIIMDYFIPLTLELKEEG